MKSATITESSGKSVELKEVHGLFECLLEHEVKSTKADFTWKGKKMDPEMWREVLAFFKWTQESEKSESQVRLFVHPEHGWMAWAFPQKGGTSMTTKELDNEDFKTQRALNIPEGYVPFGTVHHHCSATAFQSSTDTADEKGVDGLHITVGKMDSPRHDIHCRLYIKGNKFEPDMAAFWDIGNDAMEKIKFVSDLGFDPLQIMNKVARDQMCVPAPKDHPFNDIWKSNYVVEPVRVYASTHASFNGFGHGGWCKNCNSWQSHEEQNCPNKNKPITQGTYKRYSNAQEALAKIAEKAALMGVDDEELFEIIEDLGDGPLSGLYHEIFEQCSDNFLNLQQLCRTLEDEQVAASKKDDSMAKSEAEWAAYETEGGHFGYGA